MGGYGREVGSNIKPEAKRGNLQGGEEEMKGCSEGAKC